MLLGAAGLGLSGTAGLASLVNAPKQFDLHARKTSFAFGDTVTHGIHSLVESAPPPVLRMKQGEPVALNFTNGLDDYSTLHWHGIRLPNPMDGVPYLTQFPVSPGETFRYAFTPPDAGTYWYHPHCRTMEQMAYGLTGLLIVDEAKDQGYDADIALNLKDFRLAGDGSLMPYFTAKGAARAGTLGNMRTTNWQGDPVYEAPSGGLARIRIGVTDTARIHRLVFPDVPGKIIAWDGQPIEEDIAWPTNEAPLMLGPGQRVDVVLRMPDSEGELTFESLIGTSRRFNVARIRAVGPSLKRHIKDLRPLPRNPFEHPDLSNAKTHEILFGWSPEGDGSDNGLCGTFGYTFWSINRNPWAGDAVDQSGPIVTLKQGESCILRMTNASPNMHPIHLHGLVFKPIYSDTRTLPANYTDTLLMLDGETVKVALRADNPGDWAFHCHIIEHQKSGMSGFIRVV